MDFDARGFLHIYKCCQNIIRCSSEALQIIACQSLSMSGQTFLTPKRSYEEQKHYELLEIVRWYGSLGDGSVAMSEYFDGIQRF